MISTATSSSIMRLCTILLLAIPLTIIYYYYLICSSSLPPELSFRRTPSIPRTRLFNSSLCPIRGDRWIVVTSIFYPTAAIHKFLRLRSEWNVVVIGDRKTPKDWFSRVKENQSRLWFLSIADQRNLGYAILNYLPEGSYARKNVGYLLAIQCGAKIIFESDDDNLLDTDDVYLLPKIVRPDQVPWVAFHRQRSLFVNIYGSFGHPQMWPRGFPIDELRNVSEDGWHSVRRNLDNQTPVYIQQYLADLDPDVDALFRLAHPLSIGRVRFDRDQPPIVLQPFTFSPYNTQNTVTYYEAFWGLYLPVTTTFRVCDIWRGFWVQRLLWDIGGRLMFGTATVRQIRNSHSYIEDMDDEYQLYHQSGSFVRFLSSWTSSLPTLAQRIATLARHITHEKFWKPLETEIIDAWLADLQLVGYVFPSIVASPPARPIEKRAAICVTGATECIREAWTRTHLQIRDRLHGETDTFLFLSSSQSSGPVPLADRLKHARSYANATVAVLYEDRDLQPSMSSACQTTPSEFQHIWAMAQCYDLVKDYANRFNVSYQLMIHSRVDIVTTSSFKLEGVGLFNVNTTLILPSHQSVDASDDSFAIGPMSLMRHYMNRWGIFKECSVYNFTQYMNVTRDKRLPSSTNIIAHGSTSCH